MVLQETPWEAMGRQHCETHLQGRVKTELEHCCFLWEDKKSNEQPLHRLQNESICQLSRMDVQNMGRSQNLLDLDVNTLVPAIATA